MRRLSVSNTVLLHSPIPIGGYIGDKFGARLTLCVSGLIACAATAATGAVAAPRTA